MTFDLEDIERYQSADTLLPESSLDILSPKQKEEKRWQEIHSNPYTCETGLKLEKIVGIINHISEDTARCVFRDWHGDRSFFAGYHYEILVKRQTSWKRPINKEKVFITYHVEKNEVSLQGKRMPSSLLPRYLESKIEEILAPTEINTLYPHSHDAL